MLFLWDGVPSHEPGNYCDYLVESSKEFAARTPRWERMTCAIIHMPCPCGDAVVEAHRRRKSRRHTSFTNNGQTQVSKERRLPLHA
eukprot:scaffold1248_cov393-Prasinococcus_capsulatus_cf.AAC.6